GGHAGALLPAVAGAGRRRGAVVDGREDAQVLPPRGVAAVGGDVRRETVVGVRRVVAVVAGRVDPDHPGAAGGAVPGRVPVVVAQGDHEGGTRTAGRVDRVLVGLAAGAGAAQREVEHP